MQRNIFRCTWLVTALALVAGVAGAAELAKVDVITRGVDTWPTVEGSSYTSFADDPIPAGFFCPGSRPFTGKIAMNGSPLASEPPGVLGKTDTIVHRLDDAYLDDNGVATTRLQMMALSLVGAEPIDVGCDTEFELRTSLDGEQEITEMRIVREAAWGGTYASPLAISAKVVFAPVGGGEPVQLHRDIYLGPAPGSYWTTTDRVGTDAWGNPVKVDADGDGVPESTLPPPSNFVAGMSVEPAAAHTIPGWCESECCHCTPEDTIPPPEWDEPSEGCSYRHLHCVPCLVPCYEPSPEPVPHEL